MEIKKVNLDRAKLSNTYIQERQDFNKVLQNARLTQLSISKSPWFYGVFGLSSVAAATILLTDFDDKNTTNEKKFTQLRISIGEERQVVRTATTNAVENLTGELQNGLKRIYKELP
ncbi:MAG: hypothetical protein ACK457_02540 [Flavobacteriia bacterium]